MALTQQQREFIEHYLQCGFNGAEAARRAGYSERTARQQASRLLTKVDISDAIKARIAELVMSSDEVLLRLADQARSTMADFINPTTEDLDLEKAERLNRLHLVKKFTKTTGKVESVSIELYDAQAALVQIGRHHKLFTDNHDHTSKGEAIKPYVTVSPDDWDDDDGDTDADSPGASAADAATDD
jgi:phage terminase small subunit